MKMSKKSLLFMIVLMIICLPYCDDGNDPPIEKTLDIPYHSQDRNYYCGPACLQMWLHYDNSTFYTQDQIYDFLGGVHEYGIHPMNLIDGVSYFTSSYGTIEQICFNEPGAQGDLISACVKGIEADIPAIMPVFYGEHVILVSGFEWNVETVDMWDEFAQAFVPTERPVAEVMYFSDPDPLVGENAQGINVIKKDYFQISNGYYYLILGQSGLLDTGYISHINFIRARGTYYGGPMFYDPMGIMPTPSIRY